MSTLSYKNYHAKVEFAADDDLFVGRIAGIKDIITFEADNVADLRLAFEEAVDDYLETCKQIGKNPQKPYSGKLMLRLSPQVHSQSALAAELEGISLNQWAEHVLEQAAAENINQHTPSKSR